MSKATPYRNDAYINAVAAYCDHEGGISENKFCRRVKISVSTHQSWKYEGRCPQSAQWRRLAETLRPVAPGLRVPSDLGFRMPARARTDTYRIVVRDDSKDVTRMLRRDLLKTTTGVLYGAALTGPIARLLDTDPAAKSVHVGVSEVEQLTALRHQVRIGSDTMGSGALGVRMLNAEYKRAASVLHGSFASEMVREQAHYEAADLIRAIGFNFYDLGMQDEARRMWIAALAASRNASPESAAIAQAFILQNMSQQSASLGSYQEALDLLHIGSSRDFRLPYHLRSILDINRAVATAGMGETKEAQRYIRLAEDHLSEPVDDHDSMWNGTGFYNMGELGNYASRALAILAETDPSVRDTAFATASAAMANLKRRQNNYRARALGQNILLRLHALNGDPESTEDAGLAAVASARRLRSPRVVGELISLRPDLTALRSHSGVREVVRQIDDLTTVRRGQPQ